MTKFDKFRRSIWKSFRFILLIFINITVLVFSSALAYTGIDQAVSDHASTGELVITIVMINVVLIALIVWLIKSIIKHNEVVNSLVDPHTGIYTREVYNDMLKTEINRSKRYGHIFSIIVFDIDYLDEINDRYGYRKGEDVQKLVSEIVQTRIRQSDEFFRIDREKFVILATETNLEGGIVVAEKLRKAIETYKFGLFKSITASFGVTEWNQNDTDVTLLKRAKQELLKAKKDGCNRVASIK